jgi:integrase
MEETMGLTWSRVDPDRRIAYLQDTKTAEAEGDVEILHLSATALAWMEVQTVQGDYVFYNPKTKTRWKNPRASFRRAAIKEGFFYGDGSLIRPHDLRHIFLTAVAESGANDSVLAKISRHRDRRSLERYLHVRDDAVQDALDRVF